MLSKDILQALQGYAANMQRPVTFVLQTGAHSKRDELAQFLAEIASVSDKITLEERDLPGAPGWTRLLSRPPGRLRPGGRQRTGPP